MYGLATNAADATRALLNWQDFSLQAIPKD